MKTFPNIKPLIVLVSFISLTNCSASSTYEEEGKTYHAAPTLKSAELNIFSLSSWRQNIIKEALKVRSETPWPRYTFGSAHPRLGGFDCSGAIYYTLQRLSSYQKVPRTSSAQYQWLKDKGTIHHVSKDARTLDHPDFQQLTPGDLVFWSGTYEPTDGRLSPITHVGMYLGYQSGYNRPVMICASKGRYYKGLRRDGFGVYDFKIPSAKSRAQIVAYGGLEKEKKSNDTLSQKNTLPEIKADTH